MMCSRADPVTTSCLAVKGDDVLKGGSGDDEEFGAGDDVLKGGSGDDKLFGGQGDVLKGGSEMTNYVLKGGSGDDKLFGGN